MLERSGTWKTRLVAGLCWREFSSADWDLCAGELYEEGLQDDVEHRDEEEVEDGGEHHAADDGRADRVAAVGSGAGGEVERSDAEDEGDARSSGWGAGGARRHRWRRR